MKKNREKEVKDYIRKVVSEITTFVPLIQAYEIKYEDRDSNSHGGEFTIVYQTVNFYAEFYVYRNIFKQMPSEGLVDGFKHYIKLGLAHEVGHCYLDELEGTERTIEKTASLIGFLIAKILIIEAYKIR